MGGRVKLVRIDWLDAAAAREWWHDGDSTCRPIAVTSVGFLHKRTKKRIEICSWKDCNGRMAGLSVIPCSGIVKIRKLKNGRH